MIPVKTSSKIMRILFSFFNLVLNRIALPSSLSSSNFKFNRFATFLWIILKSRCWETVAITTFLKIFYPSTLLPTAITKLVFPTPPVPYSPTILVLSSFNASIIWSKVDFIESVGINLHVQRFLCPVDCHYGTVCWICHFSVASKEY